jgi:hypothetical protein
MTDNTTSADISANDDQTVRVTGTYEIQDLGRYRIVSTLADGTELQSNQLSYLTLDDGSQVRLGARPESEHVLASQRVVAIGRLKASWPPPGDPKAAQMNAKPTLIEIASVAPAD